MADNRVTWLKRELPDWVSEGLLVEEAADRIRLRYDERRTGRGRQLALIAFGVMGAKMIGSGLILLIAHNWESLSQSVRAGMALTVLAVAQALTGFALMRRSCSLAWRESTAAFLMLAVGASMALITQTYNIFTEPDDFMLRWILLALPVVYVTRSHVACALYFVGVAWATAIGGGWGERGFILWGLLAAIAPYVVSLFRERGSHRGQALVGWSAGLAVPFASSFVVPNVVGDTWMLFYAGLFAALFALGARLATGDESPWQRPLAIVGALGAAGVGLALSFAELWRRVDVPSWPGPGDPRITSLLTWAITGLLVVIVTMLAVRDLRRRRWASAILYALPLSTAGGIALALSPGDGRLPALVTNVYVFALGMAVLLMGLSRDRLLLANAGMGLLSALFFFRFVDAELTLVLRGVAFIVIGIGFLAMNVKLLWTRKEVGP